MLKTKLWFTAAAIVWSISLAPVFAQTNAPLPIQENDGEEAFGSTYDAYKNVKVSSCRETVNGIVIRDINGSAEKKLSNGIHNLGQGLRKYHYDCFADNYYGTNFYQVEWLDLTKDVAVKLSVEKPQTKYNYKETIKIKVVVAGGNGGQKIVVYAGLPHITGVVKLGECDDINICELSFSANNFDEQIYNKKITLAAKVVAKNGHLGRSKVISLLIIDLEPKILISNGELDFYGKPNPAIFQADGQTTINLARWQIYAYTLPVLIKKITFGLYDFNHIGQFVTSSYGLSRLNFYKKSQKLGSAELVNGEAVIVLNKPMKIENSMVVPSHFTLEAVLDPNYRGESKPLKLVIKTDNEDRLEVTDLYGQKLSLNQIKGYGSPEFIGASPEYIFKQ